MPEQQWAPPSEFALLHLLEAVTQQFAADSTGVTNVFSLAGPVGKMVTGDRIVWTPGDPSKALGKLGPARGPGGLCTLHLIGADAIRLTDEKLQYARAREIYDLFYRAIHRVGHGVVTVEASKWVRLPTERVHGLAIQVVISIGALIPDSAKALAPINVGADLDVEQLDHTDNVRLPEPTP
jgi:hypothetical protein